MSWLIFAIFATALYGASNFIDKFLIEKRVKDPILLTIFGGIIVFIAGALIFLIAGFQKFTLLQIFALLVSGVLSEIALIPYYKALSSEDASRIVSFFQIIPVFVLVLSYIFLGETLVLKQYLGFFFILVGGFILSIKKVGLKTLNLRKSLPYVMLASLIWAVSFVIFKFVAIKTNFWNTIGYEFFGVSIGAGILFLFYRKRFLSEFKIVRLNTWGIITINETVYFIGRLCGFYAIVLGPIALVSVISGIQPIFALFYGLILSVWFPKIVKEDIARSTLALKIMAIIIIFAGIWFINSP